MGEKGLLTDISLEVVSLKRAMFAAARKRILLADSSKFTLPGSCTLADISELDEVITDDGIAPEALSALEAAEAPVTVVPGKR